MRKILVGSFWVLVLYSAVTALCLGVAAATMFQNDVEWTVLATAAGMTAVFFAGGCWMPRVIRPGKQAWPLSLGWLAILGAGALTLQSDMAVLFLRLPLCYVGVALFGPIFGGGEGMAAEVSALLGAAVLMGAFRLGLAAGKRDRA